MFRGRLGVLSGGAPMSSGYLALALAHGAEELAGARARDGADVADDLIARHPDAVVVDRQRAGAGVGHEPDLELGRGREVGTAQRLEAQLVERVRGIGDELAKEDVLVRVEGVDHEVQQLPDFGLERVTLWRFAHTGINSRRSPLPAESR